MIGWGDDKIMSENIDELATALAAAQMEMETAKKESDNPFFKSKYSDLASVFKELQKVLPKHGIAITQIPYSANGTDTLITLMMHKSGQWLKGKMDLRPVKTDPQGVGSAMTYNRRYSVSAMAGIASEVDDDGEGAMGRENESKNKKSSQKSKASSGKKQPTLAKLKKDLNSAMKAKGLSDSEKKAFYEFALSSSDSGESVKWAAEFSLHFDKYLELFIDSGVHTPYEDQPGN